jgi:hypothetical protein
VVVFNDTASITPSSASLYLADIIRTNLAKNNVVIEVSRDLLENNIIHQNTATATATATANHIIHHFDRNNPGAPLFFPRVDECYYIPHSSHTAYETMREVSCVIDLWNNHKEMTLYVIKTRTNHLQSEELCRITSGGESGLNNESDTEGFESDADTYTPSMNSMPLDYCKIIQEYYHVTYNTKNSDRRLIIMF